MTSHDAEEVLCSKLTNNSFSIQVESTHSTNKSYIVAFVSFVNNGETQENFLCCKATSKPQDIFNVLSSYLEAKGDILGELSGLYTHGIPSMVASIKGFTCHVQKENPDVTTHCFIHTEVLV
jgi:hypothetical protein